MKHEVIPIMAAVLCGLSFFALPTQAQYGGGSGTADDPYLIFDANQMNAIGANPHDWDKHFKLMADIDLSGFTGTAFNIIGYYRSWDDVPGPNRVMLLLGRANDSNLKTQFFVNQSYLVVKY